MSSRRESLWRATYPVRNVSPLPSALAAEVAIVGGGISGLTAAVILGGAGKRVVLLERDRLGSGETGSTTSHLTEAVDGRYQQLVKAFDVETTRLVARATRDAIDWIETFAGRSAPCGFQRLPGYLYGERETDVDWLARELDAAHAAGCDVTWDDHPPTPFATHGAVRWNNQGQVHATAYLDGLVAEALAKGVQIFDRTRVVGVHDDEPCRVETTTGTVRANAVFVAAHVPVNNRVFLHTKIAAYRSYAIAAEAAIPHTPALLWDTEDPYHYTRWQRVGERTYLIIGGEDHKTGEQVDTDSCYGRLQTYARQRYGVNDIAFRWSGQIIEPSDGLPFIGLNSMSEHVYVATGYSGNGITFGTVAGMLVSDLILKRSNPYERVFAATRIKAIAAAYDYVKENVKFPLRLITNRLTSINVEDEPLQALRPGDGGVFESDEGKVAVCRDTNGVIHACSAVCTHLGCDVAWNESEQTWDCPCHGSRFSADGTVINGPAVGDLRQIPTLQLPTPKN